MLQTLRPQRRLRLALAVWLGLTLSFVARAVGAEPPTLRSPATAPLVGDDVLLDYAARFQAAAPLHRGAPIAPPSLISDADAGEWLIRQIPRWDSPAGLLNEIYYFRWWSFRKHIRQTPHGRVITEFLPQVSHAGPYNTVSCAFGHHVAEGRWLRDAAVVDEYARYWLVGAAGGTRQPRFHQFSGWAAAALEDWSRVTGDSGRIVPLLDPLVADYRAWQAERQRPDGLFWQHDVRDGMEESISGGRQAKNIRPTINSYQAASAAAISRIAQLAGRDDLASEFADEARSLREKMIATLWDEQAQFFKVRLESGELSDAREAIGFIPWMFDLAGAEHAAAWRQLSDPEGFWAPAGLTTAERRHPQFRTHGTGTCEWDGAVWPFATSQTLTGLAKLLRGSPQEFVTRRDYLEQLLRYAAAQQLDGQAYVGEYLDETTGQWLITGEKAERSRYYNHSTFADLVITGLAGLIPRADETLEIDPLLPADSWDWFCLEGVPYHGRQVAIVWDRRGERYGRGAGLSAWVDGIEVARRADLGRLTAPLPSLPSD